MTVDHAKCEDCEWLSFNDSYALRGVKNHVAMDRTSCIYRTNTIFDCGVGGLMAECGTCWGNDTVLCAECGDRWCPTCENPCDCADDDDA